MTIIKECNLCHELKDESEFYHTKVKKKGEYVPYIMPYCKVCNREKNNKWRNKNIEQARAAVRRYLPKNEAKNKETKKRHLENGGQLKWQRNNKDKVKSYNEKYSNKKHSIRKKEWEECKSYFNYKCAYCGLSLQEHWVKYKGELILSDFHKEHVNHEGANDISN